MRGTGGLLIGGEGVPQMNREARDEPAKQYEPLFKSAGATQRLAALEQRQADGHLAG